ncbi:Ser/Thr protein phosphatase family protein [alpha proteobacterium BAL199]|jgi:3',5'-cyclic AMP phosphodiesterase CpdA|nr:Ser/Thr protein phosphatase family protein [alpha proteobacterium BAL199]
MRLLAISDLHLAAAHNREALQELLRHPDDWLIVAGDVAERLEVTDWALGLLAQRFARVVWVPGNHDLWTVGQDGPDAARGVERYDRLLTIAHSHGVVTPEDPFPEWPGALPDGVKRLVIAPLFLLYDYSFRPNDVALSDVVAWADEAHNVCGDEIHLAPDPFSTRPDWCRARLDETRHRLARELPDDAHTVLVNHWPLRRDLIRIPRVPRFTPWCGTTATEDWHRRYRAHAVVSGHLHTRRTDLVDGTRFEEVSLGYPRQWGHSRGVAGYLRTII